MRSTWGRVVPSGVLTILAALMFSVGLVSAEESAGLNLAFGEGKLTVSGDGFKAGEQVTLTVRAGGVERQFMATADARGRFRLETGLAVQPGSSLAIEARGDQGTAQASITSMPGPLTARPGASSPAVGAAPAAPAPSASIPLGGGAQADGTIPGRLPRSGESTAPLLAAGAVGLSLLCGGLMIR
jgi:hypothetical protein